MVPIGIDAYKHVEKLWEKALGGWIGSSFRTSDQSVGAPAAMAIPAGLWSAGHCLHGNHAALASVSQEAPKQCGLSPLQEPNQLPSAT